MRLLFEVPDRVALLHGDNKDLGQVLEDNSVDAMVTDPPAGIDFMGKGWDSDKGGRDAWIAWLRDTLQPAIRALKPGAHALVWALPRTSHWTATALEDAGLEIRDIHLHLFGTGFPKSLTSKSAPIPEGAGTALKPAAEHWILCRKPFDGTVGGNYALHGTGVLNINACRIGDEVRINPPAGNKPDAGGSYMMSVHGMPADAEPTIATGRWPAHVSFDEDAAAVLDDESGELRTGAGPKKRNGIGYKNDADGGLVSDPRGGSKGGASRFFYVAKGARSEKDAGLDHLPKRTGGDVLEREEGSAGLGNPRAGAGRTGGARNHHPTVKSIALMRWLVRLITPPGGIVLDPFAGSGSTGVAAIAEGCGFVGCELTDEYLPILEGRIRHALSEFDNAEK